jgi:hypothetical protein
MVYSSVIRIFLACAKHRAWYFFALCFFFFSSVSYSQDFSGYTINSVDHKANVVMIDDTSHIMTLGFKVYIYETKKRKKSKVNRYALKPNQKIYYRSEVKNRQSYLSEITILK